MLEASREPLVTLCRCQVCRWAVTTGLVELWSRIHHSLVTEQRRRQPTSTVAKDLGFEDKPRQGLSSGQHLVTNYNEEWLIY